MNPANPNRMTFWRNVLIWGEGAVSFLRFLLTPRAGRDLIDSCCYYADFQTGLQHVKVSELHCSHHFLYSKFPSILLDCCGVGRSSKKLTLLEDDDDVDFEFGKWKCYCLFYAINDLEKAPLISLEGMDWM